MPKVKELSIEDIARLFDQYYKHVKANPRKRTIFVGKDGTPREENIERPVTLDGFYVYCRKNASDVHNYFENTEGRYDEYKGIVSYVREEIRDDLITGGLCKLYDSPIVSRITGLVDKSEQTIREQPLFGNES